MNCGPVKDSYSITVPAIWQSIGACNNGIYEINQNPDRHIGILACV